MDAIAVKSFSNTGAIEILNIEYGIDDYVIWRFSHERHRSMIHYSNRPYFIAFGGRQHLDEFIKV